MAILDALYRANEEKCPGYAPPRSTPDCQTDSHSVRIVCCGMAWKISLLTSDVALVTLHVVSWAVFDIPHSDTHSHSVDPALASFSRPNGRPFHQVMVMVMTCIQAMRRTEYPPRRPGLSGVVPSMSVETIWQLRSAKIACSTE